MCGHVYPIMGRDVKHVDGDLVETRRDGEAGNGTAEDAMQKKFKVLTSVARKRGYNNPTQWAFNVICGQEVSRLTKMLGGHDAQTTDSLTARERSLVWKMAKATAKNSMR